MTEKDAFESFTKFVFNKTGGKIFFYHFLKSIRAVIKESFDEDGQQLLKNCVVEDAFYALCEAYDKAEEILGMSRGKPLSWFQINKISITMNQGIAWAVFLRRWHEEKKGKDLYD